MPKRIRVKNLKSCAVPKCFNTTTNAPHKLFFQIPMNAEIRKKWWNVMKRDDPIGVRTRVHCCEDHFDVENDMENYLKHKWVGGRVKLKNGVVPHKFECLNEIEQKPQKSVVQKKGQSKNKNLNKKILNKNITFTGTPIIRTVACLNDKDLQIYEYDQTTNEIDNFKAYDVPLEREGRGIVRYPETNKNIDPIFMSQSTHFRLQEDKMTETVHDVSSIKEENISECRACLQKIYSDSTFYNIFDCWEQQEEMDTTIAENLSGIANIQISESDPFPKVICDVCCTLLQTAYTFAANVRKTDHILRNRIENGNNGISEKIWPKPIQIDRNVENSIYNTDIEIKKEVVSEEECTNEVAQEQNFPDLDIKIEPEELQSQHSTDIPLVNGTHTLDNFKSESKHLTNGNADLEEQTHTSVKEEVVSEEEAESTETDLPLECMLCMKTFNSVTGLKAHVIAQHSYKGVKRKHGNTVTPEKKKRKYTCNTCRRHFMTSTDLMVHETCHNKSICYCCNASFDTFAQLTEHRKRCKAVSNKEVTRLKTLEDVKRPHSRESQHENACTSCNTHLSTVADLRLHQMKQHENVLFLNSNYSNNNDNSQKSWSSETGSESSN